ncbi:hypothetical protein [Clostridium sp.]|uniref:hypothetical protein n=1 Tax=Clostridium sp. TaxID=1506 RepID=UPI003F2FCB9C
MNNNKVIYIGKDPNLKGRACLIIGQEKDVVELYAADEILGKIEFKTNIKNISRVL